MKLISNVKFILGCWCFSVIIWTSIAIRDTDTLSIIVAVGAGIVFGIYLQKWAQGLPKE